MIPTSVWEPGIAVVVPARDAVLWIAELLDSLQAQTRRPDLVVVVDDGSTDGSADAVDRWCAQAEHDLPVRLLRTPPRGLAAAVSLGMSSAPYDQVCRIDADDVLAPRYLEVLEAALVEHPEVAYAYSAMELFGTASGRYPVREFDAAALVFEGNFVCAGALVRRTAYEAVGGLADLPAWEDWDLWLRLLGAGHEGVLVDEPLYRWRRHQGSRNTLGLAQRRLLRARIWWRHRGLLRAHAVRGVPGAFRRLRRPIRQQ